MVPSAMRCLPIPALAATLLAIVPAHSASAQAASPMGPQARTDVRITLSIAPRFAVRPAAGPGGDYAVAVSANAPGLRYSVEPRPLTGESPRWPAAAARASAEGARLLVVIPD